MSEPDRNDGLGIPISVMARVDEACDRFEDRWNKGHRPRIEDFLGASSRQVRTPLLEALLRVECQLRRRAGERPTPESYRRRFPDDVPVVDTVFSPGTDVSGGVPTEHEAAAAPPPTDDAGASIGPYNLLEIIGLGGMGIVYLAEQGAPVRRRVALKVIRPGMGTEQVVARFEAERQALALMDHPCIAKVLDAGATGDGRPFFVMELVHGEPIPDHCDRHQLSIHRRLELFLSVCQAVQHAHQKGIIHRDLKPSNILVTRLDGEPAVKVIDFGLVKAMEAPLTERTLVTEIGQIVGTPEYMSPEQAELGALDIDTRSDIYALGVVLYELLTGSTPLRRATLRRSNYTEIMRRIREDETPRPSLRLSESKEELTTISERRRTEPSRLARLMRGEIDWIVMKALEKERGRRYETASGLARDIQRYLDGDPVEAGPPSAMYRLRKLARKHRTAAAIAGAFAIVLSAATLISLWQAVRATRAERISEANLSKAQAEETKSRASAAEAKAVLGFFRDKVLAAIRPEGQKGGLGKDVTLRAALDAAETSIGIGFADQPAVEAAIRVELGESNRYLGQFERAIRQLERARELRTAALGSDHPDAIESTDLLAVVYKDAGRVKESIAMHQEVLDIRRATLGPGHPHTLTTMHNLAVAYRNAGQIAEALTLYRDVLEGRKAVLGTDHPDTLATMNNLAVACRHADRLDEALALYEDALALQRARIGPEHPDTLATMSNLAVVYQRTGRLDEALALVEKTLKIRRDKLGPGHPDTLTTAGNLALAYKAAGRLREALPLYEETLKLQRASLGSDHGGTRNTLNNLAVAYLTAGRSSEALPLLEDTLKFRKARLGPRHADTLMSQNNLVLAYLALGRWAEAEAAARECLGLREKDQPDDWTRYHTMSQLGAALAGQKRYTEAELHLIGGYEGLKAREAKIFPAARKYLSDAGARVIALYDAWGKREQSARWRARLKSSGAADRPKP